MFQNLSDLQERGQKKSKANMCFIINLNEPVCPASKAYSLSFRSEPTEDIIKVSYIKHR